MLKSPNVLALVSLLVLAGAGAAMAHPGHDHDTSDPSKDHGGHEAHEVHLHGSLSDTARQANNPLSTLWSLQNQFDIRTFHDVPVAGGGRWRTASPSAELTDLAAAALAGQ